MNGRVDRSRGERDPGLQSDQSRDVWMAVGLFALTILSRLPFRSQILYHWDSVNFATAMREFSVAKEQPQPPGYIVYVWLCRLVDVVARDAQTTMVSISIVAGALAVVALFYLGRSMFNRWVGLIAALFLATSPLFWFYGEIALPHTLDALLVIVSVWWLYEVMEGDRRYLFPAVAVLAIAGGVRQQTIGCLAPLRVVALRRVGWARFVAAGVLGAGICLAWFVPLVVLNGGLSSYMQTMRAFASRFQSTTSIFQGGGWWGVGRNLRKMTMYTVFGWSAALLPGVVCAVSGIRHLRQRQGLQSWARLIYLFLWAAPTVIFYAVVHMGQQGLVFVFLPVLELLSAAGLMWLWPAHSRRVIAVTAVLVAVNAGIFCLAPEYPGGPDGLRLLTRATLVSSDRYYQDRFGAIEENLAPESSAILASSWHHVEYYLPEYQLLPFDVVSKWEKGEGSPKGNREEMVATPMEMGLQLDGVGQAAIVVFDPKLMSFSDSVTAPQELSLQHGGGLGYFTLAEGQAFHYGQRSFGVSGD